MECDVLQQVDVGSHTLFVGEVVAAEKLGRGTPLSYAYYRENKRGKVPKTAPTYQKTEATAKKEEKV